MDSCLCLTSLMCNNTPCTPPRQRNMRAVLPLLTMLKSVRCSIQLGEDTDIQEVFLDLMFALAPCESTCCASCNLRAVLGMQDGLTASWHLFKEFVWILLGNKHVVEYVCFLNGCVYSELSDLSLSYCWIPLSTFVSATKH